LIFTGKAGIYLSEGRNELFLNKNNPEHKNPECKTPDLCAENR
jgi:hypothetical protein